jgi:hypothetical protein
MTMPAPAVAHARPVPSRAPEPAREAADMARRVAGVLDQSPAFRQLPASEQQLMRRNLGRIATYLSDPAPSLAPADRARVLASSQQARALDVPGQKDITQIQSGVQPQQNTGTQMDKGIKSWSADAAKAGGQAMADYVNSVKFPDFVASLIKGVFDAIVNASIRQMDEYSKFLEAVVKSVDQFAQDHITMPEAKKQVAQKFPNIFDLVNQADASGDGGSSGPDLKVKDSADEMPDFKSAFGMDEQPDVSDPDGLQKLVLAAQLQLARQRQQQLAAMVMLGVNRIVVTDGKINAKILIDIKSKDSSTRERDMSRSQSDSDTRQHDTSNSSFWGGDSDETHETRVSTVNVNESGSNNDQRKLETHAQLTGEVAINFKSDYFPLEKLTSAGDLLKVQSAAAPAGAAGA